MLTAFDIRGYYARVTRGLIELVDCIPDDKMDWSPQSEQWNLRGILLHVAMAHHNWLANVINDGEVTPDILRDGQTKDGMKTQLRLSSERIQRFLADPVKLEAEYHGEMHEMPWDHSGHWIALQLLEHDIHHRADILHYLGLLGLEHPSFETLTFERRDVAAEAGAIGSRNGN